MPTVDLTVVRPYDDAGIRRRVIGLYTGPASYITGGDLFAPGDVKNLGEIEMIDFMPAIDAGITKSFQLVYSHASGKVVWIDGTTGLQVGAATNLSTFAARFEAIGK